MGVALCVAVTWVSVSAAVGIGRAEGDGGGSTCLLGLPAKSPLPPVLSGCLPDTRDVPYCIYQTTQLATPHDLQELVTPQPSLGLTHGVVSFAQVFVGCQCTETARHRLVVHHGDLLADD